MNARRYPRKVAVVDSDRRLTYAELESRTNRMAHGLVQLGVRRGDRIGLLIGNSVLFVELYVAIVKLRAIAVPFNIRLAAPELDFCVRHTDCRLLAADRANAERAESYTNDVEAILVEGDNLSDR